MHKKTITKRGLENDFEIRFHKTKPFYSNETISGQAVCFIKKPVQVKFLRCSVACVIISRLSLYSLEETLYRESKTLAHNYDLATGKHKFEFNFTLPDQPLPPSFSALHKLVCHWVISLKLYESDSKGVGLPPVIIAQRKFHKGTLYYPEESLVPKARISKKLNFLPLIKGRLFLQAHLDKNVYCRGESIPVNIRICNQTNRSPREIVVQVIQKFQFAVDESMFLTKLVTVDHASVNPSSDSYYYSNSNNNSGSDNTVKKKLGRRRTNSESVRGNKKITNINSPIAFEAQSPHLNGVSTTPDLTVTDDSNDLQRNFSDFENSSQGSVGRNNRNNASIYHQNSSPSRATETEDEEPTRVPPRRRYSIGGISVPKSFNSILSSKSTISATVASDSEESPRAQADFLKDTNTESSLPNGKKSFYRTVVMPRVTHSKGYRPVAVPSYITDLKPDKFSEPDLVEACQVEQDRENERRNRRQQQQLDDDDDDGNPIDDEHTDKNQWREYLKILQDSKAIEEEAQRKSDPSSKTPKLNPIYHPPSFHYEDECGTVLKLHYSVKVTLKYIGGSVSVNLPFTYSDLPENGELDDSPANDILDQVAVGNATSGISNSSSSQSNFNSLVNSMVGRTYSKPIDKTFVTRTPSEEPPKFCDLKKISLAREASIQLDEIDYDNDVRDQPPTYSTLGLNVIHL